MLTRKSLHKDRGEEVIIEASREGGGYRPNSMSTETTTQTNNDVLFFCIACPFFSSFRRGKLKFGECRRTSPPSLEIFIVDFERLAR